MILTLDNLAELRALIIERRCRIVTTVGRMDPIGVDDDPDALIVELLRLARLGALTEISAACVNPSSASELVAFARRPDPQALEGLDA